MPEIIATVEIEIERQGAATIALKAILQVETTSYTISLSQDFGQSETTTLDCESQGPAAAWMVQRLKQSVDEFAPHSSTIRVIADTSNLLPKIIYRCSNSRCRAKLFESWGPALGIRIVCRKCKTLGIPQRDED